MLDTHTAMSKQLYEFNRGICVVDNTETCLTITICVLHIVHMAVEQHYLSASRLNCRLTDFFTQTLSTTHTHTQINTTTHTWRVQIRQVRAGVCRGWGWAVASSPSCRRQHLGRRPAPDIPTPVQVVSWCSLVTASLSCEVDTLHTMYIL